MNLARLPIFLVALAVGACGNQASVSNETSNDTGLTEATAAQEARLTEATAAQEASVGDELATFRNFELTEDFLKRYQAYSDEAAQHPCTLSPATPLDSDDDEAQTLDAAAAAFAARPGVQPALERHGLTARELLVGMGVLIAASAQDLKKQHSELSDHGNGETNALVSPENMAFFEAHKDAYQQHVQEVAAKQMKENGGKIPKCLTDG